MSDKDYEIDYPQDIRGGAGFIPEPGMAVIQGYHGAEVVLTEGNTPQPNGNSMTVIRRGVLQIEWKRAGSSDHPQISAQTLINPRYFQVGEDDLGFQTTIDFMIEIKDPRIPEGLGSGPNGKGWYFFPVQEFLKPDFDRGSGEVVGDFQMWVNDGHVDIVGGSKWSRNVGSGIDGILLNIDGGDQPVAENYPRTWPVGSKLRVQIEYWVPA